MTIARNIDATITLMRKLLTVVALLLLWVVIVIGVIVSEALWFAAPDVRRGDFRSIENHLVRHLKKAEADRELGSAALVLLSRGEIAAAHTFKVAEAPPVDAERSLFLVASVSKAVTAWGVMNLVEEGKVDLDAPVIQYLKRWQFPKSDAHRDKVTVRHLLSHTAGIEDAPRYTDTTPTDRSTVGALQGVHVSREPGVTLIYSSGGYTVLQLLIEEVTQRPFAGYMREEVLQPLGMDRSDFDLDAILARGDEAALVPNFDPGLKRNPHFGYVTQAPVSFRTAPRDLAQFAQAFTRPNRVLSPSTIRQMLEPQRGTSGSWALGHSIYAPNGAGRHIVGHSGGTLPASGAMLRVNPATGNAMVLMVSGGRGSLNHLPHDWVYWESGVIPPEGKLQRVYDRAVPGAMAIVVGGVAIVIWILRRR